MIYVSILRHPTEREPLVEKLVEPNVSCGPDVVVIKAVALMPLFPRGTEWLTALPNQLMITHPTGATVVVCMTRLYSMVSVHPDTTPPKEVVVDQPEQAPTPPPPLPFRGKSEMTRRESDPENVVEI